MAEPLESQIDKRLERNSKLIIENLYKAGLVPLAAAAIRYPSPENRKLFNNALVEAWNIMNNDFNFTNFNTDGSKKVPEKK